MKIKSISSMKHLFLVIGILSIINPLKAQELIIGTELVEPGIRVIFEGAIKDDVTPSSEHLSESQTDVHLEARVNWASDVSIAVPKGTPRGGFVPYLTITAEVVNERTGESLEDILVVPHINLIDNFHYARNIKLPGKRDDLYTVKFYVNPPEGSKLASHKDWRDNHSNKLFSKEGFEYKNVDFEEIANANRR
ncbi:MAG: iron transporter [Balneola sp.]